MLIGIDASRALRSRPTGTERYSREIICHLLQLSAAKRHRWRLYVDQAPDAGTFPAQTAGTPHSNLEVQVLPWRRMWSHRALGQEVVRRPPDVLFVPSHVIPYVPIPSRLPASVVTVHDLGYHDFPESHTVRQRLYLTWSTRWSVAVAARVIAVSYATAADIRRHYGAREDKIRVIHEAAPVWQAPSAEAVRATRSRYGLHRPYALYVGTIQPRKNVARLIQAYTTLAQAHTLTWDLALAGGAGWLSEPIFNLVRTSRFADRIHLTGYFPEEELPSLLAGAAFFCYPSLSEGFGLPVLEAQSAGVPVMTANSSSLPEVAGDAALLVDPTDVDAIAAAMLQLSQDDALCRKLIAAGFENVKRFSWEKAAQETLTVLEEASRSA
jgi:glycosyltransferase involved in cell wall biosynthesis